MFLFVYNTLYIICTLFFVSSILYDRYDFLFSSFFFFVNCIQFLDVGEVCVEISFHSGQ